MHELGIDIETYSDVDIAKSGMHKYAESPNFEITLISWSLDGGEVITYDIAQGQEVPEYFLDMLLNEDILKTAHNAQFEMTCLSRWFNIELDLAQWECTAVRGTMLGYPLSLDQMSKALGLDVAKDLRGKALIKLFAVPNKKTGRRVYPHHEPIKWQQFVQYNRQDVVVEQEIRRRIEWFKIPQVEREWWLLDQKINKTGIMLDDIFVEQAISLAESSAYCLVNEAKEITGIDNPNSTPQLKKWLDERCGVDIGNLQKENIKQLLNDFEDDDIQRVLQIRQELSKSSVKKLYAMRACIGSDKRARGLFQFYGANKTGRWSGRLIQVQNLTKHKLRDIEAARDLVRRGEAECVEIIYGNPADLLSQLMRTAFVADEGKTFIVSDFSAIEARVVAWFANETWRLEVFAGHGKIYEASGAQMFKVPIETVKGDVRAKAKVAELALGYQGSVGALKKMGAEKMGLSDEECLVIVKAWRKASPNITKLWYAVQEAAIEAVEYPGKTVKLRHLKFQVKNNVLFIRLPSGRCLTYINPKLKEGKHGTVITFYGVDQKTKKWVREETYGGKLVENIVQGTSRDLLAQKMQDLDAAGFNIVMHVHDEVVLEENEDEWTAHGLVRVESIMSKEVSWAPGLPLGVASFISTFYKKD